MITEISKRDETTLAKTTLHIGLPKEKRHGERNTLEFKLVMDINRYGDVGWTVDLAGLAKSPKRLAQWLRAAAKRIEKLPEPAATIPVWR